MNNAITFGRLALSLIFALITASGFSQAVNIPDANFKAALVADTTINTNRDGEIQVSEAQAAKTVNVSNKNIADMTGIEAFTSLTSLNCSSNKLHALDVSNSPELQILICSNNFINVLDVSSNSALTTLDCQNIFLAYLNIKNGTSIEKLNLNAKFNFRPCIQVDDVAQAEKKWRASVDADAMFNLDCNAPVNIPDANFKASLVADKTINQDGDGEIQVWEADRVYHIDVTGKNITDLTGIEAFINLDDLVCANNQIKSLDLTALTMLTGLSCESNQLTSLKAGGILIYLSCKNNQLTSLDDINLRYLENLDCSNNQIQTLDVSVSRCPYLRNFYCQNNRLTFLNINRGSTAEETLIGNAFDARGNLNPCIQVYDVGFAEFIWRSRVDRGAVFTLNCGAPLEFPDANFKSALVADTTINKNGDGEITWRESTEFTGSINVSNRNITDLTGINFFPSISA